MVKIPTALEKRLVQDEVIDNQFSLNQCEVFTSNLRIFIKTQEKTKDIVYYHISSMETQVKRNGILITLGLVIIIATIVLHQLNPPSWSDHTPFTRLLYGDTSFGGLFYYLVGAGFIFGGYRNKIHVLTMNVSGMADQQVFSGRKDAIDAFTNVVNKRRFRPPEIHE